MLRGYLGVANAYAPNDSKQEGFFMGGNSGQGPPM